MDKQLLIEKLRSLIGQRQVTAALFHTFNFDPDFFENYLLPTFLPDVAFSENKIHNAILWRRYATKLPPITVYCDFYGKSAKEAPQINYVVRSVDMVRHAKKAGCFHPKHSFLLLDNRELLVLVGSNNLTVNGWCSNLEVVSLIRLENAAFFPRDLKDALAAVIWTVLTDLYGAARDQGTEAEQLILAFLNKRKYTGNISPGIDRQQWSDPCQFPLFYNSVHESFFDFLRRLKKLYNDGSPFSEIEIISPYYALLGAEDESAGQDILTALRMVQTGENMSCAKDITEIRLSIPFDGINSVAMHREQFDLYAQRATWCQFNNNQAGHSYRFNHSKIWRFKGKTQVIIVAGSVNCTMAACAGIVGQHPVANMESALVQLSPVSDWQSWLTPVKSFDALEFSGNSDDDESTVRPFHGVVPQLEFIIDWQTRQLFCHNHDDTEVSGVILAEIGDKRRNICVAPGEEASKGLSDIELQRLAANPLIDFHKSGQSQIWYYYAAQQGMQAKPIPERLQLNDAQILDLWTNLNVNSEQVEQCVQELLGTIIDGICDEDGCLDVKAQKSGKSTLNTMAAHLSALINLENWFKDTSGPKAEQLRRLERQRYYLTINNIDTIPGYIELLRAGYNNKQFNGSFYWLVLEILKTNIYGLVPAGDVGRQICKEELEPHLAKIHEAQKRVRKELSYELCARHFDWAANNLKRPPR